jgi:hypothetical protein
MLVAARRTSPAFRQGHRAAGGRGPGDCRAARSAGGASGVVSLLGIIAGVAAVLAVVMTLFIGVCLTVARITDAVRGRRRRGVPGERDARSVMPSPSGGRRRDASGEHVASGRGGGR